MFNLIPWRTRKQADGGSLSDSYQGQLTRLRDDMETFMNRFWSDLPAWPGSRLGRGWGLETEETAEEYVVRAEVPGFEVKDLDVQIRGDQIVVKAERKEESKSEGATSYQYGSFHRSFPLPAGAASDKIDARYHSGVLELHLPKTEQARGKRIAVKAS